MIQIQILAGEYWKGVYSRKSKKNMLWVTMNATGDIPHSVLSNGAERSIKCRFLVYRWSYPWFSLALGSSWGPASYFYYFSLFPPFISLFNFFLRLYNHGVVPFCAAERVLSEVRASKIYLFKRWCWALLLRERLLQFVSSRWRFIAFRDNLLKNPCSGFLQIICEQKLSWIQLGSPLQTIYKVNALPLSWLVPAMIWIYIQINFLSILSSFRAFISSVCEYF